MERTLGIIKPDSVKAKVAGEILSSYEKAGFTVRALKMLRLTREAAGGFYAVHVGKPFYDELCAFMSSGPCIVVVLEAENAIQLNRQLMGATDPKKAAPGTLRARFGTSVQNNAVHGSDAPETAAFEIGYFFNALEFAS